ncbi:MAG: hypothetical protein ACRDD4_00095 [Culicoidibacterales bacterium]
MKWTKFKEQYYGQERIEMFADVTIDFSMTDFKLVKNGGNLSYDEYLDLQYQSYPKVRPYFRKCYYESAKSGGFSGVLSRRTIKKGQIHVCFEQIRVDGMYCDGIGFSGYEEHVWIHDTDNLFADYQIGTHLRFVADVYMYLKTGKGKLLDFGLKNVNTIQEKNYMLPTPEEIFREAATQLVCSELCVFADHCYLGNCIGNSKWRDSLVDQIVEMQKKILLAKKKS